MHPTQWIGLQILKAADGKYISGQGPFAAPVAATLWGLPVSITPAITAGIALVGCFRTAAQLFRRGGIRTEASNSHASFFVNNLIAVRSEMREALVVYKPACFGTVTGLL
jgi:HK97 family phage major capsid protein